MTAPRAVLPLLRVRGTARACGLSYGLHEAVRIAGFRRLELPEPSPAIEALSARCWEHLTGWDTGVADLVGGLAEATGLSEVETTMLLLHEEIVHVQHCSAFAATAPATRDGRALVAQNWDWRPQLFPFASLTHARVEGWPAALLYTYPGLWACTGINEHGFALTWTGAGYYPSVEPEPGVPTYAILARLMRCATCAEALDVLRSTRNAGCFVLLLADAEGEARVVEAWPGHLVEEHCAGLLTRANHYELAPAVAASRQSLAGVQTDTEERTRRLCELLSARSGSLDPAEGIRALSAPGIAATELFRPKARDSSVTLDTIAAHPDSRTLYVARGLPSAEAVARYRLSGGELELSAPGRGTPV